MQFFHVVEFVVPYDSGWRIYLELTGGLSVDTTTYKNLNV